MIANLNDQITLRLWFRSCVRGSYAVRDLLVKLQPLRTELGMAVCAGIAAGEGHPEETVAGVAATKSLLVARLASEGQCLIGMQSYLLLRDERLDGLSFRELGTVALEHELRREPVFQLCSKGLPEYLTPQNFADSIINNLPPLGYFVGRDEERESIVAAIGFTRFVTVTGAAGCGKSHLTHRVARALLDTWAAGIIRVDLSGVETRHEFVRAIAEAFKLEALDIQPGRVEAKAAGLVRNRAFLVILDGADRCRSSAANFVKQILAFPGPKVIVTCGRRLSAEGERVIRIGPMAVPPDDEHLDLDDLEGYDASALFLDKARNSWKSFSVGSNTRLIAAICRDLKGNPWDIVLAARAVRHRTLAQIYDGVIRTGKTKRRVGGKFIWAPTSEDTAARKLLDAVSWFRGSWIRADAAEMAELSESALLLPLSELQDSGFVLTEETPTGGTRYFVEPQVAARVRQQQSPEVAAEYEEHHQRYFIAILCDAYRHFKQTDQGSFLDDLDLYRADLAAAFDYLIRTSSSLVAITEAMVFSASFWYQKTRTREAIDIIERALKRFKDGPKKQQARLLNIAGLLEMQAGNCTDAKRYLDRCIRICQEIDWRLLQGVATNTRAGVAWFEHNPPEAYGLSRKAIQLLTEADNRYQLGKALSASSVILLDMGDIDEAKANIKTADEILSECGDTSDLWSLALGRAILSVYERKTEDARTDMARAVEYCRLMRNQSALARTLLWFSRLECDAGRYDLAAQFLGAMRAAGHGINSALHITNEIHAAQLEGRIRDNVGNTRLLERRLMGELINPFQLVNKALGKSTDIE